MSRKLSRRQFFKSSAVTAGAASLGAGRATNSLAAEATALKPIKVKVTVKRYVKMKEEFPNLPPDISHFGMGVWDPAKGNKVPPHYHTFAEYWFYLEGRAQMHYRMPDGEEWDEEVEAGDFLIIPAQVEHSMKPIETVKLLSIGGVMPPEANTLEHLKR